MMRFPSEEYTKEYLIDLYWVQEMSCQEIGDKLGFNYGTIYYWLKLYDIPVRNLCEAGHVRYKNKNIPIKFNCKKYTKEVLTDLYCVQKMSIFEIAGKVGVCEETVCAWMRRYDIPFNRKLFPSDIYDKDALIDLYCTQKMSGVGIAEKLGVSFSTIYNWLRTYNIPVRPQDEGAVLSSVCRGRPRSLGDRQAISKALKGSIWTEARRKKCIPIVTKNTKVRPTSIERAVLKVIEKNHLPYDYVGDGHLYIDGRCPDFISTDNSKTIIEVFGRHWHDPTRNPKIKPGAYEENRIAHYAKCGYKTVVVWEEQANDEEFILKALMDINKRCNAPVAQRE